MAKTISMNQVKSLINYTIDNNVRLEEEGKMPIAISLEASAGIGKTSIVEQVAKERGMTYVKLSLSQFEEAGDLTGFPIKEYECQIAKKVTTPEGAAKWEMLPKTAWLNEKQLDAHNNSGLAYRQTGETRMSYAKPAWVPTFNDKGVLVNLDDFSRANQQLLQATMELILTQGYMTWKFPRKTSIVITTNPDDGTNNVNSLDEAQRTRFLNFDIQWDMDAWAEWAEKDGVDGRCINFVLSYANEIFEADAEGNRICNPRSFVMFANMISGVKDWDDKKSLSFITMIAKGCFKDDGGRFSQMFNSFIRNKMHLLIQPKEMLLGDWAKAKKDMMEALYDSNGDYRPDIAHILERRFTNYVNTWLGSNDKTPISVVVNRILNFIDMTEVENKKFFNQDLFVHMIKTLMENHKGQTNRLMDNPRIAKIVS